MTRFMIAEMLQSSFCQASCMAPCSASSARLVSTLCSSRSSLPLTPISLASSDISHCNFTSKLTPLGATRRASSTPYQSPSTSARDAQLQDHSSTIPNEGINWWERNLGATLANVKSTKELSDIIAIAGDKLVIVEFFASWCGSCRALYPKLCKLAVQHKEIVFVKVNLDENKELCKSLDIKVLPYFHLYRGKLNQLDSFTCSITKLQKLKDAIAKFGVSEHSTHRQKA